MCNGKTAGVDGLLAGNAIKYCRRREQQTAKLRKTAEKLLMAQLKKHALQADTSLKVGEVSSQSLAGTAVYP